MPKHEALTPKAIANRIKAKGLQKLRWYCQMCQKQCRDENGFKCHTMSESHQRQLLLFAENPNKYLGQYSREFMVDFLELLRRRFGTKRVHANQVYQEYISDRNHLHMNATRWLSLTGFVKFLGREGCCIVDQTEKGWFITYVDRDPETLKLQENLAKKKKLDLDDQERMAQFIEKQVENAKMREKNTEESEFTELKRETEEEKVVFAIPAAPITKSEPGESSSNPLEKLSAEKRKAPKDDAPKHTNRKSALAEIMAEQEKAKERTNRKDYWVSQGIVVKVLAKQLGEKYYKKKGVILEVIEKYIALVKMQDSGDKIRVDQVHLETVIPAPGKLVKIVNGAYRGLKAILVDVQVDRFCATLKISEGPTRDRVIKGIQYEDFCKLAT